MLALKPKITVAICTYNRSGLLGSVLESVCEQTLPKDRYEIVVVDNNSTDSTKEVVDGFLHHGNVRYILERKQGLSHARNRGWRVARGLFVGYLDDDSKAPAGWLNVALRIAGEGRYDVFGGPIRPFYDVERPVWYKESYDMRDFGATAAPRILDDKEFLSGGNLFISRQLLSQSGGFDAEFGVVGRALAYGEETDLQRRLRHMIPDLEVLCEPGLYNFHLVRPEKLTLWWNVRDQFARGRDCAGKLTNRLGRERTATLRFLYAKTIFLFLKSLTAAFFLRNKEAHPYWQNYFMEETLGVVYRLGELHHYVRSRS